MRVWRSGQATGSPAWFTEMKRGLAAKRALRRLPPEALDAVSDRLAGSLRHAGFRSVYDVATASGMDYARLTVVKGMGPATLRKIHAELKKRNVPVSWEAPK